MVEFARTRNPSCRVPCRGVLAGKKSPHYIPVAETLKNETPSKKFSKVWQIWRETDHRKSPSLYPCNTDPLKTVTLPKINSEVCRFWRQVSCRKIPPLYPCNTGMPKRSPIWKFHILQKTGEADSQSGKRTSFICLHAAIRTAARRPKEQRLRPTNLAKPP